MRFAALGKCRSALRRLAENYGKTKDYLKTARNYNIAKDSETTPKKLPKTDRRQMHFVVRWATYLRALRLSLALFSRKSVVEAGLQADRS